MKLALIISAVCISLVKGNSLLYCDQSGTHYYEQIGCKPIYINCDVACPYLYKCKPEQPTPEFCRVAGKLYGHNEEIPNIGGCVKCRCSATEDESSISCLADSCPILEEIIGCRIKSSFDDCCNEELACTGYCSARCLVDGVTYQEGERFQPKNTCKDCICQRGFRGIYEEPFCRPINCQIERMFEERIREEPNLLYTCAPLYETHDFCCPVDIICSCPKNTVKPIAVRVFAGVVDLADTSSLCQLEWKFYKKGTKIAFVHKNRNVQCECLVPPQFRCMYV